MNLNNAPNILRGNKVDMLSTKNIDMKQRRDVNAAPAKDNNDYVILSQLNTAIATLNANIQAAINKLTSGFKTSWTAIYKIITTMIAPPTDSTTAIQFFKADQATNVMTIDTTNSRLEVNGSIYSFSADAAAFPTQNFARLQYDPAHIGGYYGDLVSFNPSGSVYMPLSIRGDGLTLGVSNNKVLIAGSTGMIGFFGAVAVAQQILASYTSSPQSAGYSGIASGVAGSPYAQVSDLNSLRSSYETLRLMCEDLRTKLQTSTFVH